MKKVLLFIMFALGSSILQQAIAQYANTPYVHCLVLDKTLSMTGHGGTDIWADVQDYCYEWIDGIPKSSTVLFFTYDKDLHGPQKFEIKSDNDKGLAKEAIQNVKVDGRFTWIASSLEKVVDYLGKNYPESNKRIYLITDGKDEDKEKNFMDVLQKYSSWRGDYDHLYYVDLRNMADESLKKASDTILGFDIGKGFTKFTTMSPIINELNYVIGGTKQVEQHLVVSTGEIVPSMTFSIKTDSIVNIGEETGTANVNISPSLNVSVEKLAKIEDGKYKMNFDLDFLNNSERECDIYVKLEGAVKGENALTFEPSGFCIKARNQAKPKVTIKKGWH